MTINDGVAPLIVGNVTSRPWTESVGNLGGFVPTATTVTVSQWCYTNAHVWGCDHAEKCKCGKVTRQIEPKKCQVCGQ